MMKGNSSLLHMFPTVKSENLDNENKDMLIDFVKQAAFPQALFGSRAWHESQHDFFADHYTIKRNRHRSRQQKSDFMNTQTRYGKRWTTKELF